MVHHNSCLVLIGLLVILLLVTNPTSALAADPVVIVTISAWLPLPGAPINFTLTEITPTSLNITWEMGPSANSTIIRVNRDRYPQNVSDGYLVFNGTGTYTEDSWLDLDINTYYYRAWSANGLGYSVNYAEAKTGGSITMLIALLVLALGATGLSFWKRNIVLTMCASLSWLALGLLLVRSPTSLNLDTLDVTSLQVLGFLFFSAAAGCLLWFISGIGKTRVTMTNTKGQTWGMWAKPPAGNSISRSQMVKEAHKARVRGATNYGEEARRGRR